VKVAEIFESLAYGPAPESTSPARQWLEQHAGRFGLFIGGEWLEPQSGEYFVGATLGRANAAAYSRFPDQWLYFARLDNLEAAISLASW